MIVVDIVEKVLAFAGVLASLSLLYVSGTGEAEKFRHVTPSWIYLNRNFTLLALIYALVSVAEAAELVYGLFGKEIGSLRGLYAIFSFAALIVIISTTKILADNKEGLFELNSSIFYGKFGITSIYLAVILIAAAHIKSVVENSYSFTFLLNAVFLAFLPLFLLIVFRFRSYNELIRRGDIVVLPHTVDIFVGVAASFALFYTSRIFFSLGELTMYNLLEACSLLIFVLVSVSYGKEIEKLVEAAKS